MKKLPIICTMLLGIMLFFAAAGYCAPQKRVYLKDGSIIECQSFGRSDGKVRVVVNRDVVLNLTRDEVDMKRTFTVHAHKKKHKRTAAGKPGAVSDHHPVKPLPAAAVAAPQQGTIPTAVKTAPSAPQKPGGSVAAASPPPKPGVQVPAPSQQKNGVETPAASQQKPAAQVPAPSPPVRPALKAIVPPPASTPPAAALLASILGIGALLPLLLFLVLVLASLWKVFVKAGEAGWKGIIPVYNIFVLVKIAGKPWWWFLLLFIPGVNIIIAVLLNIALAARFGQGAIFGLGLTFFGFIFFPVLAFGKAEYR
jgi:Family of unknown function (DUF5684)